MPVNYSSVAMDSLAALSLIGGFLLFVLFAVSPSVAGLVGYLRKHGRGPVDYRVFHGEPSELRAVAGIVRAAIELRPRGLIQLGLLILIATPIARVAISAVAFARRRDWLYTAFAAIVLAALLFGLLGARA